MKKFLVKLSYTVFPLWLAFVGLTLYVSSFIIPNASGDIGKLGLIPFGNDYDIMLKDSMIDDTLFQTIDNIDEIRRINADVLTIGDSFSQQKNGGYQNYMEQKGIKVVNVDRNLYSNPIQFAYNILDMNFVDSSNVRFVVVEKVEREFCGSIGAFDVSKKEKVIPTGIADKKVSKPTASRMRDFVFYRLGIKTPIYTGILNKDLFTSDQPRKLFFYHDDIETKAHVDKTDEENAKKVVELLQKKAKSRGIDLILMIAVDKYDLYQRYLVDNKYPTKTINEDVKRIFGNTPNILLTKYYLLPLVDNGTKDVFKYNDTHWSYKASRKVAEELYNRMMTISSN